MNSTKPVDYEALADTNPRLSVTLVCGCLLFAQEENSDDPNDQTGHLRIARCPLHQNAEKTAGLARDLAAALKQVIAMLTQPVQYTGIRNGASCDVLRGDCASAAEMARAALSRAREQGVL